MIYLLGMSHAISVIREVDSTFPLSHQNWNEIPEGPQWTPLQTRDGLFSGANVQGFLIAPKMEWQAQIQATAEGQKIAATPALWSLLDAMKLGGNHDVLFSLVGGNEHSVLSLIEHAVPFDFCWPGGAQFPIVHGRKVIPWPALERVLDGMTNTTVAILAAVRYKHPGLKIVHLMAPPPFASEDQIRAATEEHFKESLARYGVCPLSVRMKVYLAYCQLLKSRLGTFGIQVLDAPEGAVDALGALTTGFELGCTHGNEAYGLLVAKQMGNLLEQSHAPLQQ